MGGALRQLRKFYVVVEGHMAQKQVRLPQMLRNPIVAAEIAEELRMWGDHLEKEAADAGRTVRAAARLRKIRTVARQLDATASARLGDQDDE